MQPYKPTWNYRQHQLHSNKSVPRERLVRGHYQLEWALAQLHKRNPMIVFLITELITVNSTAQEHASEQSDGFLRRLLLRRVQLREQPGPARLFVHDFA